jgi:hypothetical protein
LLNRDIARPDGERQKSGTKIEIIFSDTGWMDFTDTAFGPSLAGTDRNNDAFQNIRGGYAMRKKRILGATLLPAMVVLMLLASNALGQDGDYKEGYGAYGTMGQDPDDILKYGRDMMRYGFRETGMSGGPSKYPGYDGRLSDTTIKKLNTEQESFIKSTEALRQTIYAKELYLKAELSKKNPDTATALGFQKEISEARGNFEQKMIEHLIRMKAINLEGERK